VVHAPVGRSHRLSTYTYWLDIERDPVTGRRRQRTKGGFRPKRECQAALNVAISAVQGGTFVEPSRRTVRSFLVDEWLPAVQVAKSPPGDLGELPYPCAGAHRPGARDGGAAAPLPRPAQRLLPLLANRGRQGRSGPGVQDRPQHS
jgi:Arm DNA-binding domain